MIENPRTREDEALVEGTALAVPSLLTEHCGADNPRLLRLGFDFDLCDREPGHPGFHEHVAP